MSSSALSLEATTIQIAEEIRVRASIEVTFAALLDQLGPYNETEVNKPMPMNLEAWPGGRWYRDLGENNGHYWGTVQAIKKPTLLEICGPLFMSNPVINNLQYRLTESGGVTVITFRQQSFGLVLDEYRNAKSGWAHLHEGLRQRAEALEGQWTEISVQHVSQAQQ
ncbi:MAG TPA: SRPBCC domain-containing protein [Candidatus Acidoferrum sp.]|nr:SRPBCC domain-containing protein [Candidatus Acidoferrum sp.]